MNPNSSGSWKTKEDVLQDLGAIGQAKISDDCLVIGNGPPPPIKEAVDEEYDLRFGGATYSDVVAPPDLNGIQQFLRMLHEDDPPEYEYKLQKNEAIVISKLNPNVEEFVPRALNKNSPRKSPRSGKSSSPSSNNGATKNLRKDNELHKTPINSPRNSVKSTSKSIGSEESALDIQKNCVNNKEVVKNEGKEDVNENIEAKPKNIIDKTNELRNKISESLKSDSPIHKKERNVAIANLLRLHSAKPSPCSSNTNISSLAEEKELKLYTPDYFKNFTKGTTKLPSISKSDKFENTYANSAQLEKEDFIGDQLENEDSNSDKLENVDPNVVKLENKDTNVIKLENKDTNIDKLENKNESNETKDDKIDDNDPIAKDEPMDTSIQESIEKVNNWLSPRPTIKTLSPTIKTSTVCMGPVSFKRKEVNGKSPTFDSKIAKSNAPVAQFKPSKYAEDLAKKYMERSQEIERRELSIWDNLEKELKKKDEKIKKKLAAKALV